MAEVLPELKLGLPPYPWKGEYKLIAQNYRFPSLEPISLLLFGSYGEGHRITISHRDRGVVAIFNCEEVHMTLNQVEIAKYVVNSDTQETKLGDKLGLSKSAPSNTMMRARRTSLIGGRVPNPTEFAIRLDRLGLAHPDFLTVVLERFFVPIGRAFS